MLLILFSLSWDYSVYSQSLWQIPEITGHGFCFELQKFWSIWCLCQKKALSGCRGLADATTQTALITQQGKVIISREIILGNKLETKLAASTWHPDQVRQRWEHLTEVKNHSGQANGLVSSFLQTDWRKEQISQGLAFLVTTTPKTLTPVRLPHCHRELYWI